VYGADADGGYDPVRKATIEVCPNQTAYLVGPKVSAKSTVACYLGAADRSLHSRARR